MKKLIYILIVLLTESGFSTAQENYSTARIPAEILKNSSVILRNEELAFTVKSLSNATMNYKTAITILNRNGDGYAHMSEYYDKFSTVYNLKATLYNADGIKIRTYKSTDFKDESMISDGNLYDDNRVKKLLFLNSGYPYTIEFSYEKDFNGYLTFPSWVPVSSFGLAVEKSTFTLEIPKDISFKYQKSNALKTDSAIIGNKLVYKWSCQNFPSLQYEPMTTGLSTVTPWIRSSPNQFDYDNSLGSADNWKNLGSWVYKLSTGTQSLPESTKATVRNLIAGTKTDKEKISILYKYLQSNTRYVSVQLGIGGFKPMAAEKVAAVNYGDCKALSNYMKSLLAEAGIPSVLVVLGSGLPSLDASYSSIGQANHMILCVPTLRDTTWLECTSPYTPAGFIGYSNAARTVLLLTENGGKLVNTPAYHPEDNLQERNIAVALTPEGDAAINIHTVYKAAQFEDHMGMMLIEPTDQRKALLNNLDIPNMEISSINIVQSDKSLPKMDENVNLKSTQMINQGGDKLFLTLNLLNRKESVPLKIENRKTPFALAYGFKDTDEIIYTLPKGYKVEFIPGDIVLESEFGKYTAKAVVKDNTIIYNRTQLINSKKYAPEKYAGLIEFYKKIYLADKQKAILAKVN